MENRLAELNRILDVRPDGWQYSTRTDRIRQRTEHMATLVNADDDPLLDNQVILGVQTAEYEPIIFFKGVGLNSLQCSATCGIAFRAGATQNMWTGNITADGTIILNHASEALGTIQSASTIIVELDGVIPGQFTFDVRGLQWPPQTPAQP